MDDGIMGHSSETQSSTFCTECGRRSSGGAYCAGCGAPIAQDSADALAAAVAPDFVPLDGEPEIRDLRDEGAPVRSGGAGARFYPEEDTIVQRRPAPAPPSNTPPPVVPSLDASRRWGPLVAVAALVAVIVAGVVVFVLTRSSDSGSDATTAYRHDVASTFGPVLGSNRAVSRALAGLSGTKTSDAKQAVRQAQSAVSSAQGALGALKPPSGSDQLASQARQALARESSYFNAVAGVLNDPASSSAGEVQTLASNVTTALAAGGATLAGNSQTISGADTLAGWARRTAHAQAQHKRHAAAKSHSDHGNGAGGSASGGTTSGGTTTGGATVNPYANGRDCGSGVYAGPNTSCDFAQNVRSAYYEAPGAAATISVFSPVTGETYTMNCSPAGSGITCSGGNSASVTFF